MSVGPLRIVTIGVTDTHEALPLFRDVVGLRIEAEWEASRDLADLWGLDGGVSARITHLSYQGYPSGQLRLVEHRPAATQWVRDDPDDSRRFYGEVLGMNVRSAADVADDLLDVANELVGAPRGTPIHFLVFNAPPDPSGKYLLVHFYEGTGRRLADRMHPRNLGISLYTHDVEDLDAVVDRAGSDEILAGPAEVVVGSDRYRIAILAGPYEERFEIRQLL